MAKLTTAGRRQKLAKLRPDFPLFPHASGRWAKKIRGKFAYFGKAADDQRGEAALLRWLGEKDALLAGPVARAKSSGVTLRDLCNHFLTAKKHALDSREIANRTFDEYHAPCERIIKAFGKERAVTDLGTSDFEQYRAKLAKTWGPVRIGNEVQRVRTLFKYGFDVDLLERPTKFGPAFNKPSRKTMRLARAQKGPRLFEATQLRQVIDRAKLPLRAMVLLDINCGLGNADCGNLQLRHVDLKAGWLNYPRPKTGIDRRCPLWLETVAAVKATVASRPAPKNADNDKLVFVTKFGEPWAKDMADSPISKEFDKILGALKIKRPGLSFYALPHTFATIGGEARDQAAVDHIMGHARDDMASVYRERISDEKLAAVTNHVRAWLFLKKDRRAQ